MVCSTCFLGLDIYSRDPAQPLTTAREELDDLDDDWPDVCPVSTPTGYTKEELYTPSQ